MKIKILEKYKCRKNQKLAERYLKEIAGEVDQIMISIGLLKIDENNKKIPAFGSCHTRWNIEKQILKERYDIDWKTPQEEHPDWMFD